MKGVSRHIYAREFGRHTCQAAHFTWILSWDLPSWERAVESVVSNSYFGQDQAKSDLRWLAQHAGYLILDLEPQHMFLYKMIALTDYLRFCGIIKGKRRELVKRKFNNPKRRRSRNSSRQKGRIWWSI